MKVIVSDFDNTFYDNNFDDNIKIINAFVDEGNLFVLATSKSLNELLNIIENKKINCQYYICNNGAVIYDKYYNPIYRKDIEKKDLKDIINYLISDDNYYDILIDTTNGYTSDYNRCANKLVCKYKNRNLIDQEIKKLLEKNPSISIYLNEYYINIADKYISKGNAIKFIMMYGNLTINQIFTIGDDINDLSMLKGFISFCINHNNKLAYNAKYTVNSFKEFINILKNDSRI